MNVSSLKENPQQTINFTVERVFRGVSGTAVDLVNGGTSCDYPFAKGETYLVYAYRNRERNELSTYYCSRTTKLSNAGADLTYLKTLSEKTQSQQIIGVLADGDKKLRGVAVVARSAGRNYRATSDKDGWFRVVLPKAGKYRVSIILPLYSDVSGTQDELDQISKRVVTRTGVVLEYDVVVEPGRCVFINPPLSVDRSATDLHEFSLIKNSDPCDLCSSVALMAHLLLNSDRILISD